MLKRYSQIAIYLCLLMGVAMLFACNPSANQSKTEYPQLSDTIIKKAQILPDSEQVVFVNKAFAGFKPGPRDRFKRHSFFFNYYTAQRDFYKANFYGDSMVAIIKPVANTDPAYRQDLMQAYFLKGDAELELSNFEAAIDFYDRANQMQIEIYGSGTRPFFNYNMRLANGFYKQGNYRQAIKYYKLTLTDKPESSDAWQIFASTQALKDNIGLAFGALNQPDSAKHYFDDALNYIKSQEPLFKLPDQIVYIKIAKGIIYGNKATVLAKQGRYDEAENLFKLDIALTQGNFGEEDGEISREKLAMIYINRRQTQKVVPMLDTIKHWASKPGYHAHRQRYLKIRGELSAQLGDFKTAHQASSQLLSLNDSLAAAKSANIQDNLQRLIDYNQQLNQIDALNKEQKQSRLLLAANGVSLLLAILIVLLLWQNYKKSTQNVSQLKTLNEEIHIKNLELGRAFDALEHTYQAKSKITQTVAHDLRSPLVAVRTFIQLLGNGKLPPQEKDNIAKLIHTNCTDSLSLIEDMLDNNAAGDLVSLKPVKLDGLIEQCILQERERYKLKGQHITFKPVAVTVLGDAEKLRRVFDNLLINAIKFTPRKGEISVLMRIIDNDVIVSVADNGIGVPADIRQKLFDISADVKRRGTADEPSHGLGLFICRQIVEAHKGEIWFNEAAGCGAIFNVMLQTYRS